MKEKLEALTAQKAVRKNRATNRRAPLPSLHPNLEKIYRTKIWFTIAHQLL